MRNRGLLVGILALLLGHTPVAAQEEAVPSDKIPKVVMDALRTRFPQARIRKSTRAREGDVVVYDLEFTQAGRKCEADITENGAYINYEKAIAATALPTTVRDAIERRYPKARLKEVMEETEVTSTSEKLAAYEVVLVTAGKKEVELRLSPDGTVLEDTGPARVPQ